MDLFLDAHRQSAPVEIKYPRPLFYAKLYLQLNSAENDSASWAHKQYLNPEHGFFLLIDSIKKCDILVASSFTRNIDGFLGGGAIILH